MALVGNEILQATGIQPNGQPSATTQQITTAQIAALAGGNLPAVAGIIGGTTRTQAGATVLTGTINRVDTSTAVTVGTTKGDGVALFAAAANDEVVVINNTANIIQLYGNGSDTINGVAGATGVPIPPTGVYTLFAAAAGSWQIESGVGNGAFGAIPTIITQEAVTANATGTIATATAITGNQAHVTVAANATAPYSAVALPQWADGVLVNIYNDTANPIQVFPYNGDSGTINDGAANASIIQMPNSVAVYISNISGAAKEWHCSNAANGYAVGISAQTIFSLSGISAAGTTQATGTPLIALQNNVTTVGAGAGVNLPGTVQTTTTASAGLEILVENNGANPLLVYPPQGATSDTINGFASTLGASILPGAQAIFTSPANGIWFVQAASSRDAGFNTNSGTSGVVLTAANITGGVASVDLSLTGSVTTAQNAQLPTVASMIALLHCPVIGTSYRFRVINTGGSASGVWTLTTNTGWTLTGTMTVAVGAWSEFIITLTATTTATIQRVASGTL